MEEIIVPSELDKRQYFEFVGEVVQLGATSEVAEIGMIMTAPDGEMLEILEFFALVDDISAGKNLRTQKFNSADILLWKYGDATLDNASAQLQLAVLDAGTALTANAAGFPPRSFLFGGQYLKSTLTNTLDATKKVFWRITYSAYLQEATFTVVGAGITLTTTSHKLV